MRKMSTLITSKGTDIDGNIANQNHATRTRTPKPGYLNLSIDRGSEVPTILTSSPEKTQKSNHLVMSM